MAGLRRLCLLVLSAAVQFAAGEVQTMECAGGSLSVCECLLRCNVFGGQPGQCQKHEDHNAIVDAAVRDAMVQEGSECTGMQCVVKCAKELGCMDNAVKARCMNVKRLSGTSDTPCDVDCSSAWRAADSKLAFVVAALFAAATVGIGA
eukprot:gb/GFBE01001174.1/.p1 GENE.gb/GFBE01001174.1/~~gb/GFBE01001174.1/.p1  ORF type:complete len:148 (+),score=34.69 gb/GFBE01001174.1/:1-444(+)